MPRSISRSPPRKGRRRSSPARSPSPDERRRGSRRSRRENRSRSPRHGHSHARRKRSRSVSPRRGKRRVSRSRSRSPPHNSRSPSVLSSDRKRAIDRVRDSVEELEKRRRQQEADLKLIEEDTVRRVEEAIRVKVLEAIASEEFKREVESRVEIGRKKLFDDIDAQLAREREAALSEARRKEEQIRRDKEELEKMLEDNRKKIEESQRRAAAEEHARKEEQRHRELETLQRQKEEQWRRKKMEEEQNGTEHINFPGRRNERPKLSFALGSK